MDKFNIGIAIAIGLMIALQIYRRMILTVKAKNTVVEKTSLIISLVMVAAVTLFGSSEPIHYVIGALLAGLMYATFAKTGISRDGLASMNRIFLALPWRALRFAKIVKRKNGQEFELHSAGKFWTNVMTFDMKDYEKTMELIRKNLKQDQFEITNEQLVEGLREKTRHKK